MPKHKHTPGPWRVVDHDGEIWVAAGRTNSKEVLTPADQEDEEVLLANAKLAAIAPEMLAILASVRAVIAIEGKCVIKAGADIARLIQGVFDSLEN